MFLCKSSVTDFTFIRSNGSNTTGVIAHSYEAKSYLSEMWLDVDTNGRAEVPTQCVGEMQIDAGYLGMSSVER